MNNQYTYGGNNMCAFLRKIIAVINHKIKRAKSNGQRITVSNNWKEWGCQWKVPTSNINDDAINIEKINGVARINAKFFNLHRMTS